MAWDVEKIVYSILGGTGFLTIVAPKVIEQWDKRHPEAAKRRTDDLAAQEKRREIEREDAEADQSNSNYWQGQTMALRDELAKQAAKIAELVETVKAQTKKIEDQDIEITRLKGQLWDFTHPQSQPRYPKQQDPTDIS